MGAGNIAVKFCHAVSLLEDCEVVAVAGKSPERAERFAGNCQMKHYYDRSSVEKFHFVDEQTENRFFMKFMGDKMSGRIDKQIVYEYLIAVPKGKVVTYGQIAEFLGNKNLARSVGNILHENPDGDKYPCYKVVNAKGNLAKNYAFDGVGCQKMRLEADGVIVNNNKVDLKLYQWSYTDNERLLRIIKMERYFDELLEVNLKNPGLLRISKVFQDKIDILEEYYYSRLWLQDYECDERGELPKNLKRGVLSQDSLYNFFAEIK